MAYVIHWAHCTEFDVWNVCQTMVILSEASVLHCRVNLEL